MAPLLAKACAKTDKWWCHEDQLTVTALESVANDPAAFCRSTFSRKGGAQLCKAVKRRVEVEQVAFQTVGYWARNTVDEHQKNLAEKLTLFKEAFKSYREKRVQAFADNPKKVSYRASMRALQGALEETLQDGQIPIKTALDAASRLVILFEKAVQDNKSVTVAELPPLLQKEVRLMEAYHEALLAGKIPK
ncbi:MAG: hypothetical protein Q7T03_11140 [Deltaproteobacteria bacterium]|nr:hypothetical protein [Deltaproteobacteria bacterium]